MVISFPIILIVGAITIANILLAYTMIKMSSATGGNTFGKIWKSYKYIFGLMLSFSVTWLVVIAVFDIDVHLIEYDSYVEGAVEYYACLFENFFSEDDTTYLDICGDRPSVRYPLYGHYVVMGITVFSTASQFVINFWSGTVSKFYLSLIDKVFQSSIATRLIVKSTNESRDASKADSKMESTVEVQNRKKSVAVILPPQVKSSKVVPIEEEQCTHRSDENSATPDGASSSSVEDKKEDVEVIREVDESGRTLTNGGNGADNV